MIAAMVFGISGCESTQPENAAIWTKPPRYGHGGTQETEAANGANTEGGEKKNRFGFGGDNTTGDQSGGNRFGAGAPEGAGNPTTDGSLGATPGNTGNSTVAGTNKTDKKNDTETSKKGGGSKSSPPPSLKSYPFGKPVPGKSGFVTLSSPHDGLGEIDVRGIAPGTPVEIPDPTKPGKKIYFRVP